MLRIVACLHALYTPAGRAAMGPAATALEMAPQERALYLRRGPAGKPAVRVRRRRPRRRAASRQPVPWAPPSAFLGPQSAVPRCARLPACPPAPLPFVGPTRAACPCLPVLQPADAPDGETWDDGYSSVGGASPAALRAWLRHMREFTYQVGVGLSRLAGPAGWRAWAGCRAALLAGSLGCLLDGWMDGKREMACGRG